MADDKTAAENLFDSAKRKLASAQRAQRIAHVLLVVGLIAVAARELR